MAEADSSTQIVCRVCGESKVLEFFPKSNTGKHGRTTRCRPCTGAYLKQYQAANKEKLKIHKQRYYVENKDALNVIGKEYYENNKDAYVERARKWAEENPNARKQARKKWDRANREKKRADSKKHRLQNPGLYRAHFKARQQRKRKAMPAWANEVKIKAIYDECARISQATGVKHHVDHYYPLKNDLVCGLHNEYNLRIIPAFDNLSKGNSLPPEES